MVFTPFSYGGSVRFMVCLKILEHAKFVDVIFSCFSISKMVLEPNRLVFYFFYLFFKIKIKTPCKDRLFVPAAETFTAPPVCRIIDGSGWLDFLKFFVVLN